ncbi:MAG TPA: phosphotransferase, partial [Microlunatus sp.]|nr:phosphotransferase [Microlunatus sp.]
MLSRTLASAGLPQTGRYARKAGWVSRVWVGDTHVVRLNTDGRFREAYRHEAAVVGLLAGSEVPHARMVAHGDGSDGPWYVSERLPGRSLHEAWSTAGPRDRRTMIESLGVALRALHRVPVPPDLMPPWLAGALAGGPWPAFHPPVVSALPQLAAAAARVPGHDPRLLAEVTAWIRARQGMFAADRP